MEKKKLGSADDKQGAKMETWTRWSFRISSLNSSPFFQKAKWENFSEPEKKTKVINQNTYVRQTRFQVAFFSFFFCKAVKSMTRGKI